MPKFFLSVLKPIENDEVISFVYPEEKAQQTTLQERLGDCKCEGCGKDTWIIPPKESVSVREGGKPYRECLNCGIITHL